MKENDKTPNTMTPHRKPFILGSTSACKFYCSNKTPNDDTSTGADSDNANDKSTLSDTTELTASNFILTTSSKKLLDKASHYDTDESQQNDRQKTPNIEEVRPHSPEHDPAVSQLNSIGSTSSRRKSSIRNRIRGDLPNMKRLTDSLRTSRQKRQSLILSRAPPLTRAISSKSEDSLLVLKVNDDTEPLGELLTEQLQASPAKSHNTSLSFSTDGKNGEECDSVSSSLAEDIGRITGGLSLVDDDADTTSLGRMAAQEEDSSLLLSGSPLGERFSELRETSDASIETVEQTTEGKESSSFDNGTVVDSHPKSSVEEDETNATPSRKSKKLRHLPSPRMDSPARNTRSKARLPHITSSPKHPHHQTQPDTHNSPNSIPTPSKQTPPKPPRSPAPARHTAKPPNSPRSLPSTIAFSDSPARNTRSRQVKLSGESTSSFSSISITTASSSSIDNKERRESADTVMFQDLMKELQQDLKQDKESSSNNDDSNETELVETAKRHSNKRRQSVAMIGRGDPSSRRMTADPADFAGLFGSSLESTVTIPERQDIPDDSFSEGNVSEEPCEETDSRNDVFETADIVTSRLRKRRQSVAVFGTRGNNGGVTSNRRRTTDPEDFKGLFDSSHDSGKEDAICETANQSEGSCSVSAGNSNDLGNEKNTDDAVDLVGKNPHFGNEESVCSTPQGYRGEQSSDGSDSRSTPSQTTKKVKHRKPTPHKPHANYKNDDEIAESSEIENDLNDKSPNKQTIPSHPKNLQEPKSPTPFKENRVLTGILNSTRKRPKITNSTAKRKKIAFGSPEAAEYNLGSPSVSLTPMPSKTAKELFSIPDSRISADSSSSKSSHSEGEDGICEMEVDVNAFFESIDGANASDATVSSNPKTVESEENLSTLLEPTMENDTDASEMDISLSFDDGYTNCWKTDSETKKRENTVELEDNLEALLDATRGKDVDTSGLDDSRHERLETISEDKGEGKIIELESDLEALVETAQRNDVDASDLDVSMSLDDGRPDWMKIPGLKGGETTVQLEGNLEDLVEMTQRNDADASHSDVSLSLDDSRQDRLKPTSEMNGQGKTVELEYNLEALLQMTKRNDVDTSGMKSGDDNTLPVEINQSFSKTFDEMTRIPVSPANSVDLADATSLASINTNPLQSPKHVKSIQHKLDFDSKVGACEDDGDRSSDEGTAAQPEGNQRTEHDLNTTDENGDSTMDFASGVNFSMNRSTGPMNDEIVASIGADDVDMDHSRHDRSVDTHGNQDRIIHTHESAKTSNFVSVSNTCFEWSEDRKSTFAKITNHSVSASKALRFGECSAIKERMDTPNDGVGVIASTDTMELGVDVNAFLKSSANVSKDVSTSKARKMTSVRDCSDGKNDVLNETDETEREFVGEEGSSALQSTIATDDDSGKHISIEDSTGTRSIETSCTSRDDNFNDIYSNTENTIDFAGFLQATSSETGASSILDKRSRQTWDFKEMNRKSRSPHRRLSLAPPGKIRLSLDGTVLRGSDGILKFDEKPIEKEEIDDRHTSTNSVFQEESTNSEPETVDLTSEEILTAADLPPKLDSLISNSDILLKSYKVASSNRNELVVNAANEFLTAVCGEVVSKADANFDNGFEQVIRNNRDAMRQLQRSIRDQHSNHRRRNDPKQELKSLARAVQSYVVSEWTIWETQVAEAFNDSVASLLSGVEDDEEMIKRHGSLIDDTQEAIALMAGRASRKARRRSLGRRKDAASEMQKEIEILQSEIEEAESLLQSKQSERNHLTNIVQAANISGASKQNYETIRDSVETKQSLYKSYEALHSWSICAFTPQDITLLFHGIMRETCIKVSFLQTKPGSIHCKTQTTPSRTRLRIESLQLTPEIVSFVKVKVTTFTKELNQTVLNSYSQIMHMAHTIEWKLNRIETIAKELCTLRSRHDAKLHQTHPHKFSLSIDVTARTRSAKVRSTFELDDSYPWKPIRVDLEILEGVLDSDPLERYLAKNALPGFGYVTRVCEVLIAFLR